MHCHATQALQGQTPADRIVDGHDMTEPTLQTLASDNPIATTVIFNQTVQNVRGILYGIDLDGKKTIPLDDRERGIAGVPVADSAVAENNKRGASHIHAQFYGGILPSMLADVAGHPKLEAEALAALDTVVRGELPLEIHAIVIAQQQLHVAKRRCAAFPPVLPETPDECHAFVFDGLLVVGNSHTHLHQATCTCGKKGKTGCRLCAPWAHGNACTTCRELRVLNTTTNADPDAGEQFRCEQCYAGGALRADPPDTKAVRAADIRRDVAYTSHSATPRDNSDARDERALAVEIRRRALPYAPGAPTVCEEVGVTVNDTDDCDDDALAALIRQSRLTKQPFVVYPDGPEGDAAARADLRLVIGARQPLGRALRLPCLHLDTLRLRLERLATDPTGDDDADELRGCAQRASTLRELFKVWTAVDVTCRNGIIADFNLTESFCTRANAMPILLGAGDGSKSVAMYQVLHRTR